MFGRRIVIVCLVAAAVLLLSGCETTQLSDSVIDAAAEGRNEVKVAVANNVKAVNKAVETVCEDLDLDRLSHNGDLLINHYVYRTEEKEHIAIFTRATSAISTEVRIQYDYGSDPQKPNDIMGKLREFSVYTVALLESASPVVASN